MRSNKRLAYYLRGMGFEPYKMEPNIWLRAYGDHHYEHIAVCADDLLITSKDPKGMMHILTNIYFLFKGT